MSDLKQKEISKRQTQNPEWQPSQKDKDWRHLSKEEFLAKYPEENPKWYLAPPPEDKFVW